MLRFLLTPPDQSGNILTLSQYLNRRRGSKTEGRSPRESGAVRSGQMQFQYNGPLRARRKAMQSAGVQVQRIAQ